MPCTTSVCGSAETRERGSVGAERKKGSIMCENILLFCYKVTRLSLMHSSSQRAVAKTTRSVACAALSASWIMRTNATRKHWQSAWYLIHVCWEFKRRDVDDVAGAKYHARRKLQPNDTTICSEKVGIFLHGGWNHDRINPGLLLPTLPDQVPNSESGVNGWRWNGCPKVPSEVGMWHMFLLLLIQDTWKCHAQCEIYWNHHVLLANTMSVLVQWSLAPVIDTFTSNNCWYQWYQWYQNIMTSTSFFDSNNQLKVY